MTRPDGAAVRRHARGAGGGAAVLCAALILAAACGGSAPPPAITPPAPDSQPPRRPLASMATQSVALLPAQYVRRGDSTGWAERIGPTAEFLRTLDAAIVAELAARNTARRWALPEAIARMARRNPAFSSDPYALSAEGLRAGVRRADARLGEPLGSQVRGLIAFTEARYALLPVEVRFEPTPNGGRAILRLALIDGRLAELQWAQDVSTETATPTARSLAEALADELVDLLVAR